MLHLDEGLVHELLDGELDPAHEAGVRAHIQECAECRRLYDDAREMLAEADRVIASLDDSVPVQPVVANEPGAPAPLIRPDFRPDATGVPIVLIPTSEEATRPPPRRRGWTPLAMAAGVILAVGAGYALFPHDGAMPAPRGGFVTLGSAPSDSSGTAAAPTGSATPALATARTRQTDARNDISSDAARAAAPAAPAAPPATPAPRSLTQRDIPATERRVGAEAQSAPPTAAATTAAAKANALRFPDPPSDAASAPGTVASNAPSRADRGRFTAAPSAAAAEAGNTPAGPPLETQAQISGRIGLDEAKRELGTSLHAIDGLRPQFVGLVPGRLVPGADPARNVVRAVYVDKAGRPFYLDQQRVAGGAAPRPTGIVRGDVQLFLHGQLPADSVASIRDRIR